MRHTTAKLLLISILASTSLPTLADECDAILRDGVRNSYKDLRGKDFYESFNSAYCTKESIGSAGSDGLNLGFSYEGVGFSLGQSSSDTKERRSENCGNQGRISSDRQFVDAFSTVADPMVVQAWQACKAQAIGVVIFGELNESVLTLLYKFKAAGPYSSTKVTSNLIVHGASCGDIVQPGMTIHTGGVMQVCQRFGQEPVTVVLNTEFGPARFALPREGKLTEFSSSTPKPRIDCARWRAEGKPGTPVECLGTDELPGPRRGFNGGVQGSAPVANPRLAPGRGDPIDSTSLPAAR